MLRLPLCTLGLFFAAFLLASGCKPKDTMAPGEVTGFTAVPGNAQVALGWVNPADEDFAGVRICRKTGSAPFTATEGTVAYEGDASSFVDTGLVNGTKYYYGAFTFDESQNFSSTGVRVNATPSVPEALPEILDGFQEVVELIGEIPETMLDSAKRAALAAKLEEATADYRQGGVCTAAGALQEYMALAQEYRLGDAVPVAEDLYNRGRMLRYSMVMTAPGKEQCAGAERLGVQANAVADDPANDVIHLKTVAAFGEPTVQTVDTGAETFTALQVPGTNSETGETGQPSVPVFTRLIAVPHGATVAAIADPEVAEVIYLNPFPCQGLALDAADDTKVLDPSQFVKNDEAYGGKAAFPPALVTLTEIGPKRDLRLFALQVAAGQYDAATGAMTLFKNVNVDVTFSGGTGAFVSKPGAGAFEQSPALSEGALNGMAAGEYGEPLPLSPTALGEELVIITHPDFADAARDLAAWKNEKGIVTNVYVVNDGAGSGPDSAEEIDALINDEYNTDIIRPSYVLLLGDAGFVPTFYHQSSYYEVGSDSIASDFRYGDIEPEEQQGGSSWFPNLGSSPVDQPEMAVGRIPVQTAAAAAAAVAKIIKYEKTPPSLYTQRSFYEKATVVGVFECCRTDVSNAGTDRQTYSWATERMRAFLDYNYSVDRIYGRTVSGSYTDDPTPRRFNDGTLLPGEIGGGSGFPWAGGSNNIVDAINAGRFLVVYRGYGSPQGWTYPGFSLSNAWWDLHNGELLPVVLSMCNGSGLFDSETDPGVLGTNAGGTYLAERLITKADGGAIGVVACTREGYRKLNDFLLDTMKYAFSPGKAPRLGDVLNQAKAGMSWMSFNADPATKMAIMSTYLMWQVFGDPTLDIWTKSPYDYSLSTRVEGVTLQRAVLTLNYASEGATITAFKHSAASGAWLAVGRGVVKNGTASLAYVQQAPHAGEELRFVAAQSNARSVVIPYTVPNI